MALPNNVISDFEGITNYPLSDYLSGFVDFIANNRLKVLDYYAGRATQANTTAFEALSYMQSQTAILSGVVEGNRNRFRDGRYWELIEMLTDIEGTLLTIENSSKWLRSAISKGNFNPQIEVERVLRMFQTLEGVADETGSNNRDRDWLNIALRNDLPEEGYTPAGGNILNVIGSNKFSLQLRSVVDNISGKKVYGIDLNRTITFEDDDLAALGYDDTIRQTVVILANLKRGQTPEFPDDGLQGSLVNGTNRNTVAYPILLRQYYNTFEKDDTLKSLKVTSIKTVQDALAISFEIETRLSEVIQETTQI